MTDHRFIEESFPVKEVGEVGAKEKRDRHGTISTLHTWWARRPLVTSRTTSYAALTTAPRNIDEWQQRRNTIIDLSGSKKLSAHLLEKAHTEIIQANAGSVPRVLDPFAGGGSYPFEALRLGCKTYAGDYNPVAVLIMKASIEYPQRFGRSVVAKTNETAEDGKLFAGLLNEQRTTNPLLESVRRWGAWVLQEARKELGEFYPTDPDGSTPVAYIWARTIPCQNPACRANLPLIRQYWLAKFESKAIAVYPDVSTGSLTFKIVGYGSGYEAWPEGFDAEHGTVSGAVATCPVCGTVVDDATTRRIFQEGHAGKRMIAVVLQHTKRQGKSYRISTAEDEQSFQRAREALDKKREQLLFSWGIEPVPDEPLPPVGTLGFRIQRYGMNTWGDLFNVRQQLSLITFSDKIRQAHERMLDDGVDQEFANAVATYLAMGVDRLADNGSELCVLNPTGGRGIKNTFARQTVQMVWDYAEGNPFNPEGAGWPTACEKNEKWIEYASSAMQPNTPPVTILQGSAAKLLYSDGYFDAVLTDPPYYDNVPYSFM